MSAAIAPAPAALLDADQYASYLTLCEDVVTIVGVDGLPREARDCGRAVTRAYVRALEAPAATHWRAYHRAVSALLAVCAHGAASAVDFPAVSACARLRAFLRENPDLAAGAPRRRSPAGDG